MATVSSHTLNGVDGSHAGGIAVRLVDLATGRTVFDTRMDDGGRLTQEVAAPGPEGRYHIPLILSPHGYSLWSSTEHG